MSDVFPPTGSYSPMSHSLHVPRSFAYAQDDGVRRESGSRQREAGSRHWPALSLTSSFTRGIIFSISKKAMTRRVGLLKWQRELRVVKAVQKGRLKMDLEPPGRIVKPAGTARYSSRVFMALSGVPVKSSSGDGGEKKSGNTVIHRLSIARDDFLFPKIGRFFI